MIKIKREIPKRKSRDLMTEKEKLDDEIYNSGLVIEKILNSKKIRYDILNQIFDKIPKNIDTVTMYIDVFSILNNLYNPNILETISSFNNEKSYLISSNLINIAAHFRNYFATRKSLYTNFVFFYSLEESEIECAAYPDYRKDFYTKRLDNNSEFHIMNNLIKSNLMLCQTLSNYLPHIYFLNTKEINPNLVPYHFIMNDEDNTLSIIYSNDKVQMLNCIHNFNTYLLTCNYGSVNLYSRHDLIKYYTGSDEFDNVTYHLLPYLYCISGAKKYNIKGFPKYAEIKSANLIKSLLDKGIISNIDYKWPEMFLEDVKDSIDKKNYDILERNIKLFHIPSMYEKLSKLDIIKRFSVEDLQDMKSLVNINNEYYEKYPIHLEEIMLGEEYETLK